MFKYTKKAGNTIEDEFEAVKQLAEDIGIESMCGVMFFCSAKYDLKKIQEAINENFSCDVVGCTSTAEMTDRYQKGGIVGMSFSKEKFAFHVQHIEDEANFTSMQATTIVQNFQKELRFSDELDKNSSFVLLLNDGTVAKEEQVASLLSNTLNGISLVGGSASDDLTFDYAPVFIDGEFRKSSGVVVLIETKLDFKVFKIQHYVGSSKDLIITESDPANRRVYEINGEKAAVELASIIGISKEELNMQTYSTNPLVLEICNEWYVRCISKIHDDDSLSFACSIDNGIPLTVGKSLGLVKTLSNEVSKLTDNFSDIELTIGFECIHRKLEIEGKGLIDEVQEVIKPLNFVGFATYGEQYNAIHINQTLTGVVIGTK